MAETIRYSLELAPLPNGFQGNPQQFAEAMTERLRVLFPPGQGTVIIQDTEPESNQGPWIHDGMISIWNEEEKRYLPLDISASWQVAISPTAPADPAISPIWIEHHGTIVTGVWVYLEGAWRPVLQLRGTTAERPVAPPEHTRFYDTTIEAELFYRRGQWRTVYGSTGDIKFVSHLTLEDALKYNPGWAEFGSAMPVGRGRVFVPAHKDFGATPETDLPPLSGITSRKATETFGEETVVMTIAQMPTHSHFPWQGAFVYAAGGATGGDEANNANIYGSQPAADTIATKTEGHSQPHPNMQPTMALWCLIKLPAS